MCHAPRNLPSLTFSFLFSPQHECNFGEGILNNGKAKKREKRPLTQIEIMAAVEREKTLKKAAKRAAKVRQPTPPVDSLPFPCFRVSIHVIHLSTLAPFSRVFFSLVLL